MKYLDELETLLPTKVAIWSVRLTAILLIPAFLTPHFLSPLVPSATAAEIVLMQILLPVLITLTGSFVTLISILSSHHQLTIKYNELKDAVAKYIKPPLPSHFQFPPIHGLTPTQTSSRTMRNADPR